MYSINLKEDNISVTWTDIYWGIKKGILSENVAVEYASRFLENNPDVDNAFIIELLIMEKVEKDMVLSLLKKIMNNEKNINSGKEQAMKKIRYLILKRVEEIPQTNQELLSLLEEIYCDFDYPVDMEPFISYMPSKDNNYNVSQYTTEENEQHLVQNFHLFMKGEMTELQKI